MYRIFMKIKSLNGKTVKIDEVDNIFEACRRADLYKKKNSENIYYVENSENLDLEYETN